MGLFPKDHPPRDPKHKKVQTYFDELARNKDFVEKSAENLLAALDTTGSGTLNKAEIDAKGDGLLMLIAERCATYDSKASYCLPRESTSYIGWQYNVIPQLQVMAIDPLWNDLMTWYARDEPDKAGKALDVPKTEVNKFDLEVLLRNTFAYTRGAAMGTLKPEDIYPLSHHFYMRPEGIDYECMTPPKEAVKEVADLNAARA